MSLVLDSSATLAWIYDEEIYASIRKVFVTIKESGDILRDRPGESRCDWPSIIG